MKERNRHNSCLSLQKNTRAKTPATPHRKRNGLIRLDTNAIRRKALNTYHQTEKTLAALKAQLKQYQEHDIPGFKTWIHRTFGKQLTRQRDIAHAIDEKRLLIFEIEEYANTRFVSEIEAYIKVLWRRKHPEEALEEDRIFQEEQAARRNKSKGSTGDDEDFFTEPGDLDKDPGSEWNDFDELFEMFTGKSHRPQASRKEPDNPDTKTAKEIYRTIVRRIHPDHHGQMSEARQNLWHEAQAAYRNRDINTLYRILSQCDENGTGVGNHSPVSLIQRLTRQLKRSAGSARNEIRKMRTDHAWNFENKMKNPAFIRQIKMELEDIVYMHESELREINAIISQLDREAARAKRNTLHGHTTRERRIIMDFDIPF